MTNAIDKLARQLIRAELAARGVRDPELAEATLAPRLRVDPDTAEIMAFDANGNPMISSKSGHPNMGLPEFLEVTMKSNPDVFGGPAASTHSQQRPATNPFAKGPGHSITEAMILYRKDPELAEQLAAEAGFNLGITR